MGLGVDDPFPVTGGASVADELLRVHRSYLSALRPVLRRVHALAHITGGGLPGNVIRAIPDTLDAVVELNSWIVPPVFGALGRAGNIPRAEMFRTFNMGVGMVVIAATDDVAAVVTSAADAGVRAWLLGRLIAGSGKVVLSEEEIS